MNIIILVNRGTTSGAELFASILKENHKGTLLVGEPTGGDGNMYILLPDGSKEQIPCTMYNPKGLPLDDFGMYPDIRVDDQGNAILDAALKASRVK